ncbi:hypothetical protein PRK78_001681 [Emydomyces testavorans]|uniref:Uncharacterized protein n=1 Tax=Emydomyces testavorans TaxID=2070801 RepID=A0AAF0DEZ5_9EURO|nr:hypothetical protein PRK78_001681 [Emydomyces testavorans]
MPRPQVEKTMSSRLLTMKFMQRAAAASTSAPATPGNQKSAADAELPTPLPKRQKLSNDASPSDLKAISAAIKLEEEKRAAAIAKQAAEAGETEWVLEFPAGTIKNAPTSTTDIVDVDEESEYGGRRSYGNFKKKTKAVAYTAVEEKQDENAEEGDDEVLAMIQAEKSREDSKRKSREQTHRKNQDRAPKGISSGGGGRRSDEVDLRKLNSISGGFSRERKQAANGKWKGSR